MLSLPNDGRYPTLDLTPQQRRQRTLEALVRQVEILSNTAPVLAATGNLPGINSAVTLEAQDWPTIGSNATWLLSAVNMASPTTSGEAYGSTSSAPAQCSMFSCLIGN